jgi:hypothetical protein
MGPLVQKIAETRAAKPLKLADFVRVNGLLQGSEFRAKPKLMADDQADTGRFAQIHQPIPLGQRCSHGFLDHNRPHARAANDFFSNCNPTGRRQRQHNEGGLRLSQQRIGRGVHRNTQLGGRAGASLGV